MQYVPAFYLISSVIVYIGMQTFIRKFNVETVLNYTY